jgi:hypothetical protein
MKVGGAHGPHRPVKDRFIDREGFHEKPANGGEWQAVAIGQGRHGEGLACGRFVAAGQAGGATAGAPSSGQ